MSKEVKKESNPKERFKKAFDSLARNHNAWTIWCDFIDMSAYSIANRVDFRIDVYEQREQSYLTIAKKYSSNELTIFSKLLGELVLALEENSEQDFLGEFYMNRNFGNSKMGQFFTSWNVSELVAKIVVDEKTMSKQISKYGYYTVNDPACGSGVMLMAFAKTVKNTTKINYQQDILFVGQDIDPVVAKMCYIQLSLLGCPGYIIIGDSLSKPVIGDTLSVKSEHDQCNIFFTPFYFVAKYRSYKSEKKPDVTKSILVIPKNNKPAESENLRTVTKAHKKSDKYLNAIKNFFIGGN